jgi:hypothetical protein
LLLLALLFAALLAFLAGLLAFLLSFLLPLFAFCLILLAPLFAAASSALSIGEAARAQQCRRHRNRHCRSFPIFSVHSKTSFHSKPRRELCSGHRQAVFQSSGGQNTSIITQL